MRTGARRPAGPRRAFFRLAYFLVESIFVAVSLLAMPVSAAPVAGAGVLMAEVSAGMAPDSEPVPPVVAPVSLFGGLHAASPKAVMAANRNVDERFMVSLPWAAPARHHR